MKKHISLFSLLLFGISTYAQNDYFYYYLDNHSFGVVQYQGELYSDCHASMYSLDDNTVIFSISENDKKNNPYGNSDFNLYLKIQKEKLINSNISYSCNEENEQAAFLWEFTDWKAQHYYASKDSKIYIQNWKDNYYSISGKLLLDNLDNDSVQFSYFGKVEEVNPEVLSLFSYKFNDPKDNNGKLFIDDKTVEIPFALLERKQNVSFEIFFMDRFIFHDKELEYAVSFKIDYNSFLIEKDVVFEYNQENRDMFPAFFNRNKTEYPKEAILKIKKPKKEVYQIEYSMKLDNGSVIKGNYKGKFTELD